jgi:hypothetical protein
MALIDKKKKFQLMEKAIGTLMLLTITALPLMAQVAAGRSAATKTEEDKLAEAEIRRLNTEET